MNKITMNISLFIFFLIMGYALIKKFKENQEPVEKQESTIIEMQKINSQWIVDTIEIPENCKLMIVASGGTYSLNFKKDDDTNKYTIRGGIIDFNIIRKIKKKE